MTRGWFSFAFFAFSALTGLPAYAQQAGPPPAVLVQPAELRSMTKQAEFVGRAEALEKVDLRARVQGFLGPRLFKDGDEVKEDQVVFTIEKEPFEAAVDQRKAQLAAAQATLANADQQLQRTAELTRKGNAPVAQLDQRTAEQGQAKAAVMEAEANLRDAADPAFLYRDQDRRSPAGSGGRRSRPAIWSGRIPACSRPSSKTTRCRCSSRSRSARCSKPATPR